MINKTDLRNITRSQLHDYLTAIGIPSTYGDRIFSKVQQPGLRDILTMDGIKNDIRVKLSRFATISRMIPATVDQSRDGTVKFGFVLSDRVIIESALIPSDDRWTLCVSSQAGCAMGCAFCLTGTMGLIRNLQPAEIVNQVIAVLEYMIENGVTRATPRELINNLVFMGMGEPLANYDNLIAALDMLMDAKGLEFTQRRVTVSTCGISPKIRSLGKDARVNLAVSLHAADDPTRSRLMPVNKTYPIDDLLSACRSYPLSRKKIILIEYILLQGINDSDDDAHLLAEKLDGLACRVNLLPYNESGSLPYKCPNQKRINRFQEILRKAGITTLIRNSRGADIKAACGQLATVRNQKPAVSQT